MDFYTEIFKGKNKRLIVEGDKEVLIYSLDQEKTYRGLKTEKPNKLINANILNSEKNRSGRGTYLIDPPRIKIPFFKIYKRTLPSVICRADVKFDGVIDNCDFSSLTIVWFQDDFAFPIENKILKKIKEIPYSLVCNKYSY
ncbi:hypothetical protein MPF19_06315 [Polaribacter sp. Z014]|uniref:hypothetical protein n=1 Tax=unclassified Polaribacter TaxID=196858 RepID=UPI00193C1330|nr:MULTISPECIES: hypothetical protein [unclassified Polaribacter]MCL7763026.1 hypothetical protein [Polaribacter sp. Z014]QVY65548.1 hypothetical protein JOP69_17725 [Polaribacter sp. Q13]